jgi:hypothetical protein
MTTSMAENKVYKSLVKQKTNERLKSEFGQGVISFVSWERIQPHLEMCVDKKPDETIEGIKIDDAGIHVKIVKNGNRR